MSNSLDLEGEMLNRCADYLRGEGGEPRRGLLLLGRLLESDGEGIRDRLNADLALRGDVHDSLKRLSRNGDPGDSVRAADVLTRLGGEIEAPPMEPREAEPGPSNGEQESLLDLPFLTDREYRDTDVSELLEEAVGEDAGEEAIETARGELEYLQRFHLFEERADDLPLNGVVGVLGDDSRALQTFLFQLAYRKLLQLKPVLVLSISPDDAPVERLMKDFPKVERFRERGLLTVEHLSPDLADDAEGAMRYLEQRVQEFVTLAEGDPQVVIHPLSMFYVLFDKTSVTRLIFRLRPKVKKRGSMYVGCCEGDTTPDILNLFDTVMELKGVPRSNLIECVVESPPGIDPVSYGFEFRDGLLLPSSGTPEKRYTECDRCGDRVLRSDSRSHGRDTLCEGCAPEPEKELRTRRPTKRRRLI